MENEKIIKDTELEQEYLKGTYKPITLTQAVETCKELVAMFNKTHLEEACIFNFLLS